MAAISPRDVLSVARSQIGITEKPYGSNKTKYGAAYGWDGVSWCGIWLWWVFKQCGVDLREKGIASPASTNAFDAGAKRMGWRQVDAAKAQPGDVVFYDFGDLDGRGPDTANDDDHVGICSKSASGGYLYSIEANTSPGTGGSQANGGGVFERQRALSLVRHVYRPPYEKWSLEMASAAPTAEEDDMPLNDVDRAWFDQRMAAREQPALDLLKAQAAQITALQQGVAKLQTGHVDVDALAAAVAARLTPAVLDGLADRLKS